MTFRTTPFRVLSFAVTAVGLVLAFLMVGVGPTTGPVVPAVACAIGAALAAVSGLRLKGKMAQWVVAVATLLILAGLVLFLFVAGGLGEAMEGVA